MASSNVHYAAPKAAPTAGQTGDPTPAEPGPITWSDHPARQRPGVAMGVVGVIAAFGVVSAALMAHWAWGVGAAIVMLVALNRFFLPSRWTLSADQISASYPLKTKCLRVGEIRRFAVDAYGGFLSTRAQPSRMDPYSGMHLRFPPDQREQIIARIRAAMADSRSATDSGSQLDTPDTPDTSEVTGSRGHEVEGSVASCSG